MQRLGEELRKLEAWKLKAGQLGEPKQGVQLRKVEQRRKPEIGQEHEAWEEEKRRCMEEAVKGARIQWFQERDK